MQIASGLGSVTSVANAGDSRLFLTLRSGRILVWDGSGVLLRAFLDISRLASRAGGRGLFSMAFHPRYESNGFFFLGYTDTSGSLAIARYRRSATNGNRADPRSGVVLLTIPLPANADHSGGELQFGLDGYLYVGVGDGGSVEDPPCNALRDDVVLGRFFDWYRRLALRGGPNGPMGNHYHLPIETPLGKLSRRIKAVNGRYAQWFSSGSIDGTGGVGSSGSLGSDRSSSRRKGICWSFIVAS